MEAEETYRSPWGQDKRPATQGEVREGKQTIKA
jgi:hypothetical protein